MGCGRRLGAVGGFQFHTAADRQPSESMPAAFRIIDAAKFINSDVQTSTGSA